MAQADLTDADKTRIDGLLARREGATPWECYCTINGPHRIGLTYGDVQYYVHKHGTKLKNGHSILMRGRGRTRAYVYTIQPRLISA